MNCNWVSKKKRKGQVCVLLITPNSSFQCDIPVYLSFKIKSCVYFFFFFGFHIIYVNDLFDIYDFVFIKHLQQHQSRPLRQDFVKVAQQIIDTSELIIKVTNFSGQIQTWQQSTGRSVTAVWKSNQDMKSIPPNIFLPF